MDYDSELPGGFQSADFEMRALQAKGDRSAALRKRGICDHGWLGPQNPSAFRDGKPYKVVCLHCGATFESFEAAYKAHDEIHA